MIHDSAASEVTMAPALVLAVSSAGTLTSALSTSLTMPLELLDSFLLLQTHALPSRRSVADGLLFDGTKQE